jgi:hypothetical protein
MQSNRVKLMLIASLFVITGLLFVACGQAENDTDEDEDESESRVTLQQNEFRFAPASQITTTVPATTPAATTPATTPGATTPAATTPAATTPPGQTVTITVVISTPAPSVSPVATATAGPFPTPLPQGPAPILDPPLNQPQTGIVYNAPVPLFPLVRDLVLEEKLQSEFDQEIFKTTRGPGSFARGRTYIHYFGAVQPPAEVFRFYDDELRKLNWNVPTGTTGQSVLLKDKLPDNVTLQGQAKLYRQGNRGLMVFVFGPLQQTQLTVFGRAGLAANEYLVVKAQLDPASDQPAVAPSNP